MHFLGVLAYQQGSHAEAERLISAALALNPANAPAHNNLGNALAAQGRLDAAIASYRQAVGLAPGYADARANLGAKLSNLAGRLNDQCRPAEALACAEEALALRPDLAEAHNNRGNALQALARRREAEIAFRCARELKPDLAAAGLNLGFARLLHGDYAAGLPLLEKRFAAARLAPQFDQAPRWTGQEPAGRTLLVWSEQGLGDSIMMARYLALLKRRGFGKVIVYCEPALARLFQETDEVISREQPAPAKGFDWQCPFMSLPLAFGTRVDTIPRDVPYVRVSGELNSLWKERLASVAPRRVGIAWAGTRLNAKNVVRSVRLEQFAPLSGIQGLSFVSLQKGDGSEELDAARWKILDRMSECADLLDSAALINQLDLVITVDTAVAHLAGALGKPVWMLNRYESEWRWMLEREDSPWYPTMRIFRQEKPGDWDAPIARVAEALRALSRAS